MAPAFDQSSRDDTRLLNVGLSALVLGLALGALATLLMSGEGKAIRAGAAQNAADWHGRLLDSVRAGREKIERAAENRA